MLGISTNTKSTWYNLRTAYEDKYKIPEGFHNNIDLKNSQTRRKESLKKSKFRFNYDDEIENILHEYFNCKIGAKEAKQRIIDSGLYKRENLYKKVYQYDKQGKLVRTYKSVKETETFGFCRCEVSSCCKNKRKQNKQSKNNHRLLKIT